MSSISINTEVTSLEQAGQNKITGIIFFDFGTNQFPENNWNDSIVVVLCWWLSALRAIVDRTSNSEELHFMEGSLYIYVEKLEDGLCRVDCIDEDGDKEFSGRYCLADLLVSLQSVAKLVLDVCLDNGWENDDVEELNSILTWFDLKCIS